MRSPTANSGLVGLIVNAFRIAPRRVQVITELHINLAIIEFDRADRGILGVAD
jgi:hypothetical protein